MTAASRPVIWALVIVFAGAGGYFAYKFDAPSPTQSLQPVATTQSSSLDQEDEMLEPPKPKAIPERLPDFSLVDLQGRSQKLSNWPGRPLMVNFWATWCEPCRREIPLLIKLRKQHASDGLEIIGVAVDFPDAVRKYAATMGIDYPVLIGEQEGLDAIAAFGMQPVFPFSVFSDRQARIVAVRVGELHEDEAALILGEVKAIDQGRRTLAEAKQRIADQMRNLAVEHTTAANAVLEHHHEHDRDE